MSSKITISKIEACLAKPVKDIDCVHLLLNKHTKALIDQEKNALQDEFEQADYFYRYEADNDIRIEDLEIINDEVIQENQFLLNTIQTAYEQAHQGVSQKNREIKNIEGDLSTTQNELNQMKECSWRASPPGNVYTDQHCVNKKSQLTLTIQNYQKQLDQMKQSLQQQTLERNEQYNKKVVLENQIIEMQYTKWLQSFHHINAIQEDLAAFEQQTQELAWSVLADEASDSEATGMHSDYHYDL